MMENPSGSVPIQETRFQVLPESVVRTQRGLPSLPLAFAAVMKSVQVCLSSMM